MIKKIILITFILTAISSPSSGDFSSDHTGRYCAACHAIQACSGNCHISEDSVSYIGVHVNPTICSRCHGEKLKNQDIHAVHGKKDCSNCHSSEGWNSSVAKIPPSGSDDSMAIPKSGQCSYCHSFNYISLHGIHQPFLVEEKCPKCHGSINYKREEILRITGKEPEVLIASTDSLSIGLNPEFKETLMKPINMLTDLFNSIAKIWMGILKL